MNFTKLYKQPQFLLKSTKKTTWLIMISKLNAVVFEAVGLIITKTKYSMADPPKATPADISNPLVM